MKFRRGQFTALVLILTAVVSVAVIAQKDDKKQNDAQRKEIQSVVTLVDGLASGQPAANDLSLMWVRDDLLKAQGNKQYVPFTVSFDASSVSGANVALYWRVVSKDAANAAAAAAAAAATQTKDDKNKDKDKDKGKKQDYAYEDISFVPVTAGAAQPVRVSRSFTVPAGNYDVYVVVKEPTPEKPPKNAPPPKLSALKQSITVPDLWNGDLATSTIIVASRIDPLPAPLTPQQQADRPYALGQMEIIPAFQTKFSKASELSTFMLIYNPKVDASNKPDVTVEYNFYQKPAGQPEKFFNKTSPQNLNKETLPATFDFAAGHQLQTGQAVSLTSFPEGDYRLEIKVTDKIANKTLTREYNFTVTS